MPTPEEVPPPRPLEAEAAPPKPRRRQPRAQPRGRQNADCPPTEWPESPRILANDGPDQRTATRAARGGTLGDDVRKPSPRFEPQSEDAGGSGGGGGGGGGGGVQSQLDRQAELINALVERLTYAEHCVADAAAAAAAAPAHQPPRAGGGGGSPWTAHTASNGALYYHNPATNQSSWEPPADELTEPGGGGGGGGGEAAEEEGRRRRLADLEAALEAERAGRAAFEAQFAAELRSELEHLAGRMDGRERGWSKLERGVVTEVRALQTEYTELHDRISAKLRFLPFCDELERCQVKDGYKPTIRGDQGHFVGG